MDPTTNDECREEVTTMATKKPTKMKARSTTTTTRAKATKKASPRAVRQAKRMQPQAALRLQTTN
jgi:hypothetical protein